MVGLITYIYILRADRAFIPAEFEEAIDTFVT